MTFFERQPETPKPFPKTTNADLHAVLLDEPGLQFGKRRVGFAHHAGAKALVMRGKLRLGAARPRPRARLSGRPPPPQSFVDIRHADLEDRCRRIGTSSRFNRRHDPLAQILRVSSAHRNPPSNQQGKRITNKAPWESQRDSTRSENALDDAGKAETLLRNLARRLEKDWEGVSASILEGLDEMLTVTKLGLPPELRRSLACTLGRRGHAGSRQGV